MAACYSEGWAGPLRGFMRESEFLQTLHCNSLRLENGSVVKCRSRALASPRGSLLLNSDDNTVANLERHPKEERIGENMGNYCPGLPYVEESISWIWKLADILADGFLRWDTRTPSFLLHPLGGYTKADDVPLSWRMKQHEKDGVLDSETTVVQYSISYALRWSTEVQWHAKPDNAGVCAGIQWNGPSVEKEIYMMLTWEEGVEYGPGLSVAAYDKTQGKMAFFDPSRHGDFIFIFGTKMRTLAKNNENPPDEFMCPGGWKVLVEYYDSLSLAKDGKVPEPVPA
uniref:Sulphate adenylyltransferase catalytic domain-containing protein n=1 Tax=Salix viminalis TaxID=40686 RepID=A0A6N2KK00_SALVM